MFQQSIGTKNWNTEIITNEKKNVHNSIEYIL